MKILLKSFFVGIVVAIIVTLLAELSFIFVSGDPVGDPSGLAFLVAIVVYTYIGPLNKLLGDPLSDSIFPYRELLLIFITTFIVGSIISWIVMKVKSRKQSNI